VPALYGIDTRQLTRKIRSNGTMKAYIKFDHNNEIEVEVAHDDDNDDEKESVISEEDEKFEKNCFKDPNESNLVARVSNQNVRVFGRGNKVKILAVDCGMKHNIIRMLVNRSAEVFYIYIYISSFFFFGFWFYLHL
jgi:carbamoylphosphate synthase small subunit